MFWCNFGHFSSKNAFKNAKIQKIQILKKKFFKGHNKKQGAKRCPQRGLLGRVSQKEYNIPIQICTIKRNNLKTYDLFSTIFQESIWNFYQEGKMKNYIEKEWGSILYFYQFGNWKLWYSSKKHNAIKFSRFLANNSFNFLESVGDFNFFVNV